MDNNVTESLDEKTNSSESESTTKSTTETPSKPCSESIASRISDAFANYFNKAYKSIVITFLALTISGCAIWQSMTVPQKAIAVERLSRAATISWLVLDSKSSKHTDTLANIVIVTKNAINEIVYTSEDVRNDFYDAVYAKVDVVISNNPIKDELVKELERSVAKFAIKETQKLLGTFRTDKLEDAALIINSTFDGILSGLAVSVTSTEYIDAVNAMNESKLESTKLSTLKLNATK
jgi:hypothetical protein